ncbi:MAG: UbiA family prenyltransferase [Planctomycetota bacterium]|nr:UbiA family prenyltransferase [Planctomycetota bacterium]
MRPGDWTKNSFVLLAFIFWAANAVRTEGTDEVVSRGLDALRAFAAFSLAASGFYAINDAIDAEKDRQHPVKSRRPVASGAVSRGFAVGLGVVLEACALALAATLSKELVAAVALYGVLQLFYNLKLKRIPVVDVTTIATGFALRAAAGAVAIDVRISVWLVLCVFFLCLYLGFIKRMCDLVSAERAQSAWKPSADYRGRDELQWLLGISAVMTVLMYLSYALSDHAQTLFGPRATGLALLAPLVLIAIHRFWRRANEGSSDSPLDALRSDGVVLSAILLFVALLGVVLFVPQAATALDGVFLSNMRGAVAP